ncbi:MAG: OmpA family protein [Bacteroidetes bacterium]|nr:OmpA family protein [Bacteroidota bacterium]
MKKTLSLLIPCLFIAILWSGCTAYYLKKANREYESFNYVSAIDGYKKVLKSKVTDEAQIRLADSYRQINKSDKAEEVYAEVVKIKGVDPINYLYYAKALINNGKRDAAKPWLDKYISLKPDDKTAQAMRDANNNPASITSEEGLFKIDMASIDGLTSCFGALERKDEVIFSGQTSVGIGGKKDEWSGESYYDIYTSKKSGTTWSKPQGIEGDVNGIYHEGPATFNKTGDEMYFTRSNYFKKKLKASSKSENNLKIFKAKLVNGKWEGNEEMPFNSDEYSVGHPSLSADGKTLYFTSDMPGGKGSSDIYFSKWEGAKWSKPENMGPEINTSGKESFPYVHDEDSSFYFSSDGNLSLGGLDIFKCKWDGSHWSNPENIKAPLNSQKDDFALSIKSDGKGGYLSSNRGGEDRIYEWAPIPPVEPVYTTEGVITDKATGKPLPGAKVVFKNMDEGTEEFVIADENGKYKYTIKPNTHYDIVASKDLYFVKKDKVFVPKSKLGESITKDLALEPIIIDKPIVIENIYYDVAKWDIRPEAALELDKLVQFLKDNAKINIELSSHTDCRASNQYNLTLSEKRAKSAVDYLISKGIEAARLKAKGYGETKLLNKCADGVTCTDEEHQMNRRTEIKVLKITG